MRIHLIAIGGAVMHNIALELKVRGHHVSGSDDEIYEPSLSRLKNAGILPVQFGWYPDKILADIDFIILGMHAKGDNPELCRALELKIPVYSYPEFIYNHAANKKRIVIAGSHGKTTTTAMIMHVLQSRGIDFDFLVGAQLDGFDRMVRLTEAPLMIIEGDEYLSSSIDRVPKIHYYKPHIAIITGIAWDHMNVFPTFEIYTEQFLIFIHTLSPDGCLIFYKGDDILSEIVIQSNNKKILPYEGLKVNDRKEVVLQNKTYPIAVIGLHNLRNMSAALVACQQLGITVEAFMHSISDFNGASRRLQKLSDNGRRVVFLDFAHAPSKVKTTTESFKAWYQNQKLLAVLELHTFSSLNKNFIPQYVGALDGADKAIVFYNTHTLKMKNMPDLDEQFIVSAFNHKNLEVITDEKLLHKRLLDVTFADHNLLLMTSGNFNKMNMDFD